ncbi:uncharacterized protein LOC108958793 [Eucalyptus grandis]|uniref:uncharacterized protein LOC108958793 n=1 Tax=Eucalyptus grandis TaxID=71139 RepID=UPI00192EE34C|nr:uncharacterized protein LOC108958793 [Eucalyptus grandis]
MRTSFGKRGGHIISTAGTLALSQVDYKRRRSMGAETNFDFNPSKLLLRFRVLPARGTAWKPPWISKTFDSETITRGSWNFGSIHKSMYKRRRSKRVENNFHCNLVKMLASDFYMSTRQHGKESLLDTQGSWPLSVPPRALVKEEDRSLFEATVKGDWKKIKKILSVIPTAMTAKIMTIGSNRFTMLEVAIMATRDQLVEKLVKQFPPKCEDATSKALSYAARGGRMRILKALLDKIDAESKIIDDALELATESAPNQKEVIWYLARRITSCPSDEIMGNLLLAGHLVVPVCLVDTTFDDSKNTKMARAPFIKRSGELKFRHHCSLELAKLTLIEMKKTMNTTGTLESLWSSGVVLDAASRGVSEIVDLCLKHFPELIWDIDFAKELITEIVKGRHVELFRLVNAHNPIRHLNDGDLIDLMKAVTKWSPRCVSPDVSGKAFLLQRELQWFQVVEVTNFPSLKWLKFQLHRKTYWEVFVEQRKELHKEAGQWMKDTSSSCSLVATLIITVAFAAAFTVPGGNDNSTGIPIFQKNVSFIIFAVADALALLCSITATLMFLAILTSRYAIEDFRYSLPRKMILGLTFLFLSLVSMLVAFGSTLMIVLSERLKWVYIPIISLAAFPAVLFAILQLPLFIEMVESTYRPRLYRPLKLWK